MELLSNLLSQLHFDIKMIRSSIYDKCLSLHNFICHFLHVKLHLNKILMEGSGFDDTKNSNFIFCRFINISTCYDGRGRNDSRDDESDDGNNDENDLT